MSDGPKPVRRGARVGCALIALVFFLGGLVGAQKLAGRKKREPKPNRPVLSPRARRAVSARARDA